jgi:hypothetical protein
VIETDRHHADSTTVRNHMQPTEVNANRFARVAGEPMTLAEAMAGENESKSLSPQRASVPAS